MSIAYRSVLRSLAVAFVAVTAVACVASVDAPGDTAEKNGVATQAFSGGPSPGSPCTPPKTSPCCAFESGCSCAGIIQCQANDTFGACVGSTPLGEDCP